MKIGEMQVFPLFSCKWKRDVERNVLKNTLQKRKNELNYAIDSSGKKKFSNCIVQYVDEMSKMRNIAERDTHYGAASILVGNI